MATILGIDPSLTSTGLAVWRDGRLTTSTIRTKPDQFDCEPARWSHIVGRIWPHIDGATVAMVEAGFPHTGQGGAHTSITLAGLRAIILYGLWARSVPFGLIGNQQLKVYALGRGSRAKDKTTGELLPADKETVLLAAIRHLPVTAMTLANNNEADAAWLAAMTADHYGRPLTIMPDKHRAVLDRIVWPNFVLEAP